MARVKKAGLDWRVNADGDSCVYAEDAYGNGMYAFVADTGRDGAWDQFEWVIEYEDGDIYARGDEPSLEQAIETVEAEIAESKVARRKKAMRKQAKYVLYDNYGMPQAGCEEIEFDEWWKLEEYLDENPEVIDRIDEGYATIGEKYASRARRAKNASYRKKNANRRKKAIRYIVDEPLENFEWWSGAEGHARDFTTDELQMLDGILDEELWYGEPPTDTTINDIMWFEPEYLMSLLGYEDEDEFYSRAASRKRSLKAVKAAARRRSVKGRR